MSKCPVLDLPDFPFGMRLPVLALVVVLAGGDCSVAAQDLAGLFGHEPRELTHVVGASGEIRAALRRARSAELAGEWERAATAYESLLREIAAGAAVSAVPLVAVPTGDTRSSQASGVFRRADEVALWRMLAWPAHARSANFERITPTVNALARFAKEGGDEQARAELARAYPLFLSGADAALEMADRFFENGQIGRALGQLFFLRRLIDAGAPAPSNGGIDERIRMAQVLLVDASDPSAPVELPLIEFDLGEPLFAHTNTANYNRAYRSDLGVFDRDNALHTAMPLGEPARVEDLLVLATPMTLQVLDLARGGSRELTFFPDADRSLRSFEAGDPRFMRIVGQRGAGLRNALRNVNESLLTHFPLPRMEEQWIRLAPVVDVEAQDGGGERAVVYVVIDEDAVARGYLFGGLLTKLQIAERTAPGERMIPLAEAKILWAAQLGAYLPSGAPLLRRRENRVAIGAAREPVANESALEIALIDLDADTGEIVSLTPVSRPPTNRAWLQDRDVIALPHPVALTFTSDRRIIVVDNRGTIAAVDPYRLVRPAVASPAAPIDNLPVASIEWAVTYRSLQQDGDAYDSGLRGWAASPPIETSEGLLAIAPSDADELFIIGHKGELGPDLELPVMRWPRENARFLVGASQDQIVLTSDVVFAYEPESARTWRGAPRADDGVLLRRGCIVGAHILDPSPGEIRILDARTGKIVGLMRLGRVPALDRPRRLGVTLLGNLLLVMSESGIAGWRWQ